jgi:DNA modification methylase
VLDPFGGAGTVGLVAQQLGLECTLIELSAEYAEIARKRLGLADPAQAVTTGAML